MSTAELTPEAKEVPQQAELEGQTYEIIRKRLAAGGAELRSRLEKLNEARKEVFGSIETKLLGTERITTENNAVPRDMVAIGDTFLFGYNVHLGLRSEMQLSDVFSIYEFRDDTLHARRLEMIQNAEFEKDFKDLYKYYKHTQFAKFAPRPPHLFMVFRTGRGVDDIKTFKWEIDGDRLRYIDNRSDHEFRFPPQHEFEWIRTTRDMHSSGLHPHVSIEDRLFVETVGGDLTIKIEDNTESGEGIYEEDVENKDQTLDDADIYYAILGNLILLKVRPYQENEFRYIVYNEKIRKAQRIDAIKNACVLLPDDHGIIFPGGYYLQTGETKIFDVGLEEMVFSKRIRASNGEDYLYVFYNRLSGTYVLMSYNLISQEVATPQVCNGSALFENGHLLTFRHHDEPQKHHAVQIWQTPFVGESYSLTEQTDSLLYKIGNRELVRGMAECHEVLNLISKEDSYEGLYVDIVKRTSDTMDAYFWIGNDEVYDLREVLQQIHDAAAGAINEYEKVVRLRKATNEQVGDVSRRTQAAISGIGATTFNEINDFVASLSELRSLRGEIISLKDLRYVDEALVDRLEEQVGENADRLAARCADFLLSEEALAPYERRVESRHAVIDDLTKVADAREVQQDLDAAGDELEMLIEIVGNLKIDDATQRTQIIDNISTIFSRLNQTRAALKNKRQELAAAEGAAEFHSQLKLLSQSVVNYLDICDSPEKCEELLTKVMVQVEEMEGRFAEFDDFIVELSDKRDEIYNAFEARRLGLVEARNRRAGALVRSAERILKGVKNRVDNLETVAEINGYFASDLMIEKVRDIVRELEKLEDSVKVDDIQSQLKTIREDAVRQLKDRQELYVDGQNVIQLGRHRFTVNVQELDLTTVVRDGRMCFHLTGTNFFEDVADQEIADSRDLWNQQLVSEDDDVYRAEYLAYLMLLSLEQDDTPTLDEVAGTPRAELVEYVQRFMAPRYAEGYIKGVHDEDAATIFKALAELKLALGLLRYSSPARAVARLFWMQWKDDARRPVLTARIKGFGRISGIFARTSHQRECIAELRSLIHDFAAELPALDESLATEAGEYLFYELAEADDVFLISGEAESIYRELLATLETQAYRPQFDQSLEDVRRHVVTSFFLARDWVQAMLRERGDEGALEYADEAALLLLEEGEIEEGRVIRTPLARTLDRLRGDHDVIQRGRYRLHFTHFMRRLQHFADVTVPRFQRYTARKHRLVDEFREELRLEEFRPRVLTSFVRNRLLDKVYLPLIGDNLAKQIGAAGDQKRTDLMGMLLLISPPGYGKTTLMEYIANRLGIIFMKINGPAIGHSVTSLDPEEAPNASAREEIEKLNLSLEMGDNVMIYVDDIQHCHSEFLQKFISLCDAQRKIEGVYKGRSRTYDLRGRKVCVVMAGNPYTESGEKFQIPDMLANRADTYNLGEIIGDNADVFEMSYLENSLTSNPTLSRLATKSPRDVYAVIRMAQGETSEPPELEGNFSLDELNEYVAVMKRMVAVRDVVLKVNREYIRSAGQSDDYRTEPPFKLQGSYRNMNRIAEKISPITNDRELQTLIYSAYENDAQTLTTGAEANLLKFKELTGMLSGDERRRWEEIKRTFTQNLKLRGIDTSDRVGQVIAQLSVFSEGLNAIRQTLADGAAALCERREDDPQAAEVVKHLAEFRGGLEGLRETIHRGIERMGKAPMEAAAKNQPLVATFAPDAMEQLRGLIEGLRSALPVTDEEPTETPPIQVVNRVPRAIVDVVRQQFRLMEAWMQPLAEAATSQKADMELLRNRLDETLRHYQRLMKKMG